MIKLNKLFSDKPNPKSVLFLTAMRKESEILFRGNTFQEKIRVGRLRRYQLQNNPVYLLETGIGIKDSIKDLQQIIQQVSPEFSVNFGICGALDLQIKIYDAYLIDEVNSPGKTIRSLLKDLTTFFPSNSFPMRTNKLTTLNKPLLTKQEKLEFYAKYSTPLVDMEGYFFAEIMEKLNIPLLMLKVVSDALEGEVRELVFDNAEKWQAKLEAALELILIESADKIFH